MTVHELRQLLSEVVNQNAIVTAETQCICKGVSVTSYGTVEDIVMNGTEARLLVLGENNGKKSER